MRTTLALVALISAGCTSVTRSTVTTMRWTDGKRIFVYSSPKDTTVSRVHFDTTTGVFVISNLSTQVDQAAVQAAAASRANDAIVVQEALKLATEAVKKAP
jgi:hypothetical protein